MRLSIMGPTAGGSKFADLNVPDSLVLLTDTLAGSIRMLVAVA